MKLNPSTTSKPSSLTNTEYSTSSKFSSKMSFEMAPKAPAVTWDELRKEARTLENQIDVKLVSLSKFGTNLGQARSKPASDRKTNADRQPLLANGSTSDTEDEQSDKSRDEVYKTCFAVIDSNKILLGEMTLELDSLLSQLSLVNESLSNLASTQTGPSSSVLHTLQRHQDILKDYRQEFNRTKANLVSTMERRDLLQSVRRDITDFREGGSKSRMDLLLKESDHIRNSERLIDEQINIAIESRETLINQRQAFKAIQAKLNDLSSRFPVVNNLVQKINFRKRRDTIIVGTIIGLCLTFLLWFAFA